MTLGPVMLDLAGTALDPDDVEMLRHPAVGGVILFSRNYAEPAQLAALVEQIHALREPRLLVAVDQEGGRVQRFRDGFTILPPLSAYGTLHDRDRGAALALCEDAGWLLAAELRSVGVDISFAPVLDVASARSAVIGDRALHADADTVVTLARAMMRGMRSAGMAAVGKHFPGHGSVPEDSHFEVPVDCRTLDAMRFSDLLIFERMVSHGIPGIMPAHVVYPEVDSLPAGFSRRWLHQILRGELGFSGAIFSDDLCMAGASVLGDMAARAKAALDAGCDMLLVCNDRRAAEQVVEMLGRSTANDAVRGARLARLHGRGAAAGMAHLGCEPRHTETVAALARLTPNPELDLEPGDRLA